MIFESRTNLMMAAGLSCLAGYTDAVGFKTLGGFFVSFMSGNSTRLGVNLSAAEWSWAVLLPLAIIVLFTLGVMAGAIIRAKSLKQGASVLAFVTAALALAALLSLLGQEHAAIVFMVLGMGASNNVFVKEGEVSVGVTYMTGTLVKLGQRLAGRWTDGGQKPWLPYLVLWLGLVVGAITGAFAHTYFELQCLWAAAVFSGFLWFVHRARVDSVPH